MEAAQGDPMEKSTSPVDQVVNDESIAMLFTVATGFSLFWTCLFTMLLRNSFLDGDIDRLWYHLAIRIAFLVGMCITGLIVLRSANKAATEKGHRILYGGSCLFTVIAAISSLTAFSFKLTLPLAFDIFAWGIAGIGLSCLLFLWIDYLSAFSKAFVSRCLAASVVLGSVAYWVVNSLAFPLNITLLCLSSVASLGLLALLEAKSGIVSPAFVSLEESRKNAKPSPAHLGVLGVYGIVFGLGIGSITQIQGDVFLYGSIAVFLIAGAGVAYAFLRRHTGSVRQNEALRIMFPVLVIALVPMSFLQGYAYVVCNLLLLSSFICLEVIELDSQLWLARNHRASILYLAAINQTPLFLGLAVGHALGLLATITGVADYSILSAVALGLVVLLAVFITFAPFNPLASDLVEDAEPETEGQPGKWRSRCMAVAQQYGLSARETEVFLLLAKGRGIEHIQNKLFISSHTVKTHTYNIYRKIGIGSREELLDLIENDESAVPEG